MYKKYLAVALLATGITACGSGTSSTTTSTTSITIDDHYKFTSFDINPTNIAGSNCTILNHVGNLWYNFVCNANSTNLSFSISYDGANPASYIKMPVAPAGSLITPVGECATSPVAKSSCTYTVTATNVVPDSTIMFYLNDATAAPASSTVMVTFK